MKTTVRAALAAAVVVAVAVSPLAGQVGPVQTGQQLDANIEVGGGGYNPLMRSTRLDSQLYITGQVTGLRGFHGNVGYSAANEFRTFLPSETLDSFRMRSVGLEQVLRGGGGTFRAEAYYRRSVTTLGIGDIADGRIAPGSTMPLTSHGEPSVVRRLYREATDGYTGLMDTRVDGGGLMALPAGSSRMGSAVPLAAGRGGWVPPARTIDLGVSAFALPGGRADELADELYDLHRVEARLDRAVDAAVDARAGPRREADNPSLPPLPGRKDDAGDTRGRSTVDGMPPRNQDVFLDLLVCLRERRAGRGAEAPSAKDADEPIVELAGDDAILLRALAGRGKDAFNRYMARATEHMANGEFYRAVSEYERAALASPRNPLAQMGLGVGYFTAGEPLTAALHVRRAFAMFPELMRTRVDIKAMMGTTVLRHRLAALDKRLSGERVRDERMLAFVLTFMHRNAGNVNETKRYAQMLTRIAKSDKVLTGYAAFLLTGQMPAKDIPVAPANGGVQPPKP